MYIFSTLFYTFLENMIHRDDISAAKLNRWLKNKKIDLAS